MTTLLAIARRVGQRLLSSIPALLGVVVVTWGSNWMVTKTLVASVSPLWAVAIRSAIATVALLGLLLAPSAASMDLRIAVSELCSLISGSPGGDITLKFQFDDGLVDVEGRAEPGAAPLRLSWSSR